MRVEVIKEINETINDRKYKIGERLEVVESKGFKDKFINYYDCEDGDRTMDYIDKDSVKII